MRPAATELRRAVGQRLRCERGFTLIELLLYAALSIVVLGGALTYVVVTFQQQDEATSRTAATNRADVGLERLVRDLRNAETSVSVSTSGATTSISFSIPTPNSDNLAQALTWTCPSTSASATNIGTCTRVLTPNGGSATTTTEITGVQSMSFSPLNSSGTAMTLPVTSSTSVASVDMTLTVQVTSQISPTKIARGPGTSSSSPSTSPIVLQAAADLRNFA